MPSLIEWLSQLRQAHVGLVALSGALFALRGLAVLRGASWARWAMARPIRLASYTIDSLLLAAALGLLMALQLNPLAVPWLATKLLLLLVYIVLGSLALKRARSTRARVLSYAAALLCFGFMVSVARAHHPWGVLRVWLF